jgi:myo-inositol 2-dehydrogenase/D-chiro-inositol 1-dehydrogenase
MGNKNEQGASSRRDFLKTTTVAAGAAVAAGLVVPGVHAAGGRETIKVGLIGCGGRGTGAIDNVLHAAEDVTIVGLADAFQNRLDDCKKRIKEYAETDEVKKLGNKVDVDSHCYVGLNAYDDLINKSGANYIILATPPGFRPLHLQAAVAAGKNIFTEKPVGVDGPGIRKVLKAYEEAKQKGLHIAAGTQRRHDPRYIETIQRVKDGAIGELMGGRAHWMQDTLWQRVDEMKKYHPEITGDVAQQIYNWYNYTWLCGDHIVEQHVHNLDVLNWAFGSHPESALGMGFRTRTDHRYPKDVHAISMCRQITGCTGDVGEYLVGTKGTCVPHAHTVNGQYVAPKVKRGFTPYVQEHTDLIESIRSGKPLNELKQVAESTLTAIMGRMSAYTGKEVSWEQALNSKEDLMPKDLTLDMSKPVAPVAIPGKTPFI